MDYICPRLVSIEYRLAFPGVDTGVLITASTIPVEASRTQVSEKLADRFIPHCLQALAGDSPPTGGMGRDHVKWIPG